MRIPAADIRAIQKAAAGEAAVAHKAITRKAITNMAVVHAEVHQAVDTTKIMAVIVAAMANRRVATSTPIILTKTAVIAAAVVVATMNMAEAALTGALPVTKMKARVTEDLVANHQEALVNTTITAAVTVLPVTVHATGKKATILKAVEGIAEVGMKKKEVAVTAQAVVATGTMKTTINTMSTMNTRKVAKVMRRMKMTRITAAATAVGKN